LTGPPIVGVADRDGIIDDESIMESRSQSNNNEQEEEDKTGKLTPCEKKIYNKYMAMANADKEADPELRFLKRHAAISGIVTSDTVPHLNNSQRAERIDTLARGSIPVSEIENAYDIAKTAVRKMYKMNSYTARVSYGSNSNSSSNNNNDIDPETGLTSLEKQLRILEFDW
jgi:hypothetical protein